MKKIHEKFKTGICYKLLIASFIFYMVILIWIILFKCASPFLLQEIEHNLIKWPSISVRFLNDFELCYIGLAENTILRHLERTLNILVFIPLGMYLPLLFKNFNYFRDFMITFIFVLFIETMQLFLRIGVFSFWDLLVNLFGLSIGSLIFYILKRFTSDLVINYIQLGILFIALPTFIYAIISVPMNFYLYEAAFNFTKYPYIF